MAGIRRTRLEEWREHVDELCYDGERVERRIDLARATIVVTTQRVLAFVPTTAGPDFRHVDRPNVGTVTVETSHRLAVLCMAVVAAFAGVAAVETATSVGFTSFVPTVDLEEPTPLPGVTFVGRLVGGALEVIETALAALEMGVLLGGVAALVVATGFAWYYVRSRTRLLVVRVSGSEDLVIPLAGGDREDGLVADLEAAIRPGTESPSALEGDGVERDRAEPEESGSNRPAP